MRWAKWILPALLAINGAVMMLAPAWWYPRVPGVIQTGPLNDHFVRDIGAAYLACDFPGVFLPAILGLWVVRSCLRRQGRAA